MVIILKKNFFSRFIIRAVQISIICNSNFFFPLTISTKGFNFSMLFLGWYFFLGVKWEGRNLMTQRSLNCCILYNALSKIYLWVIVSFLRVLDSHLLVQYLVRSKTKKVSCCIFFVSTVSIIKWNLLRDNFFFIYFIPRWGSRPVVHQYCNIPWFRFPISALNWTFRQLLEEISHDVSSYWSTCSSNRFDMRVFILNWNILFLNLEGQYYQICVSCSVTACHN